MYVSDFAYIRPANACLIFCFDCGGIDLLAVLFYKLMLFYVRVFFSDVELTFLPDFTKVFSHSCCYAWLFSYCFYMFSRQPATAATS